MTLQSQVNRINYSATGNAATDYSFPFWAADKDWVRVAVDGEDVSSSDYTVDLANSEISFVSGKEPTSGKTITIYREVTLDQQTDYTPNGPFPAESHEQALDKLTAAVQELDDGISRSLRANVSEDGSLDLEMPTFEDRRALIFELVDGQQVIGKTSRDPDAVANEAEQYRDTTLAARDTTLAARDTTLAARDTTLAAYPDPENATDGGTDAYVSETTTTPPSVTETIRRDFQSANTTTTPTLDSFTITTKDGSALWAGALSGVHELQLNAGGTAWLVLDPNPLDGDQPASVSFIDTFTRGHIDGLELANNSTDSDHDIDIATGICSMRDGSGNRKLFELTSGLTKQIDAAWAAGTDAGGLPSGLTLAADTHYNVFLIGKDDGTADAGFDTDASAANLLADASNYSWFRRIGSVFTDGSSNIRGFIQKGDRFLYKENITDINDGSISSDTKEVAVISVPPLEGTLSIGFARGIASSSINLSIKVFHPGLSDVSTANGDASFSIYLANIGSPRIGGHIAVAVNAAGEIAYIATASGSPNSFKWVTRGWVDSRGRNQ